MAELRQRIQTALNENRILVLGTQVLLGFQLRDERRSTATRLSTATTGTAASA